MRTSTGFGVLFAVLLLTACGGTRVLDEPLPMQVVPPLANAADGRLSATLDWVVVRNNPGTWAANADWDEYLFRVSNNAAEPLELTRVAVFDSLGTRLEPRSDRKALVKASKETSKRYRNTSAKVQAGHSGAGLFASGVAVTAIGAAAAVGAAQGAILAGASSAGAAGAVAGGILLAGPALAVGGIVRSANNSKVDKEIRRRHTSLPVSLVQGEALLLDLFFPLAPSPTHMEIMYRDRDGDHVLRIDLIEALNGLHLKTPPSS